MRKTSRIRLISHGSTLIRSYLSKDYACKNIVASARLRNKSP